MSTEEQQTYKYGREAETEPGWGEVLPTVAAASIITDSLLEQVLTAGLFTVFWFYVNLVNGFIIFVIKKSTSLRENYQYPVLIGYIISDMVLCNCNMMMMIPLLIANDIDILPPGYCSMVTMLIAGALYTNIWMIGYLAYERYVYFVRPLKYPRYFSSTKIRLANIFMYIIGFSVALITTLSAGREFHASNFVCGVSDKHSQEVNLVTFLLFWIPSGCTSIISLIRIRLLTSKHRAQVAAQFPNAENVPAHNFTPIIAWKRTVKTVALVSGAFWVTATPGILVRIGISAFGFSAQDIDSRDNMVVFAVSRGAYLLITAFSSFINPVIYFTLHKDLRKAAKKYIKTRC